MQVSPEEQKEQEYYRDARFTKQYDGIWKSVGKCVFCDLRKKYVFFEENGVVMTVSLYAYIDGHLMIIPRRHIRSPKELTQLEWDTIRKFAYIAKKLVREVHGTKGMQIVQKDGSEAQSTVDQHLHFHCIPFDAPDLCEWNYRKLQYTPIESAQLYRTARKKIIEHDVRFDEKYRHPAGLPIVCDLIILNTKQEILLEERREAEKLVPDYMTLPGGGVDRYDVPLEIELAREVQEETGLDISKLPVRLLASRLGNTKTLRHSRQLHAQYPVKNQFMWNTYIVKDFDPTVSLVPGDDCKDLIWMPLKEAIKHPRISKEVRVVLQEVMHEH
jgi:histidine triad (HIT) family protein